MNGDKSAEAFWRKKATLLSHRVNFGHYLQTLAPVLVILSVLSCATTLIIRRELPQTSPAFYQIAISACLAIALLICYFIARRKFETTQQSLVRLESADSLHSALSAADAGVSPWPKESSKDLPLKWHTAKSITPAALSILLLLIGILFPITPKAPPLIAKPIKPSAWTELTSELEELAEDEQIEETYLDEIESKLSELQEQKQEDWFSHASMEATDNLQEAHRANTRNLQEDLSELESAVEKLTQETESLSLEQQKQLAEKFEKAREAMQNGVMKPNEALMSQLTQLDSKQLGKLSKEQLQQLKKNMKSLNQSLRKAGPNTGDEWAEQLMGESEENSKGNGPGAGGIQRGPGHDPNLMGKEKNELTAGELAALEALDLSRASPGDLLQIQNTEHELSTEKTKASTGGSGKSGLGGQRVWKEALDPAEQKALRAYFE